MNNGFTSTPGALQHLAEGKKNDIVNSKISKGNKEHLAGSCWKKHQSANPSPSYQETMDQETLAPGKNALAAGTRSAGCPATGSQRTEGPPAPGGSPPAHGAPPLAAPTTGLRAPDSLAAQLDLDSRFFNSG